MFLIRKSMRPASSRTVAVVVAAGISCSGYPVSCGKKEEGKADGPAKVTPVNGDGVDIIAPRSSMVILSGEMEVLPGMKVLSEQKLEMLDGLIATRSPGGNTQGHIELTDKEVRRIEYVSERERKVVIDDKEARISMETGGAEPVETLVHSPLKGLPLTARRQNSGKWWYGPAEGDADAEAVNELADMSRREMLALGAYPKEPRAIGDAWEASLETVGALLGTTFEASEGSLTMRLVRLVSHEGQRCAEIGVGLRCVGSYAGAGSPMSMELALEGTILRSLNTFQDLEVALAGPMKLKSTPGADTTVSMEGTIRYSLKNHMTRE